MPTCLFWATYEQQGNTIALWADEYTDRTINLVFWSAEIPTTWFQAFNPFMIFAFTPFVVALWARQAQRGAEPSTVIKMALGCAGCGLAYLIMAAAAYYAGPDKASWLWLFAYFVVITIGELYISPIGLSLVSKVAPARHVAMMMGVWLGTSFIGNFLAGYLGSFWSTMAKPDFFVMIAAVALRGGSRDLGVRPAAAIGAQAAHLTTNCSHCERPIGIAANRPLAYPAHALKRFGVCELFPEMVRRPPSH